MLSFAKKMKMSSENKTESCFKALGKLFKYVFEADKKGSNIASV